MNQKTQNTKSTTVTYSTFANPAGGTTTIQGIRGVDGSDDVYIAGTLVANGVTQGLVYQGPLTGNGDQGAWHTLNYSSPEFDDVTSTSCYGPNNGENGNIQLVGAYQRASTGKRNLGFLYQGPITGGGQWITISPNDGNTNEVFVHSTMGGLAVGNYDVDGYDNGYAFLYDIETGAYIDFAVPGSYSTTLYGIWHNGGNSYTLAGGSTRLQPRLTDAFLIDYDSATGNFSHLKTFAINNNPSAAKATHFEGITTDEHGGYNMPAGETFANKVASAGFANVKRNADGSFGEATWTEITFPGAFLTTGDCTWRNTIQGVYVTRANKSIVLNSYTATIGQ